MTWTTRPRSEHGPVCAIEAGSGPLVVLIHGVGLRAEAWGAQIDHLAQSHRVLAVDMPGHGHSEAFSGTPELARYTDAIAAMIDAPAAVIGHSFGAMIALDMAVRYPHKLVAVAALNAIFRRSAQAAQAVRARADSLDGVRMADPAAPLARWFGDQNSPAKDACRKWLCDVDPAGYRAAYGVFAREDGPQDGDLDALDMPALFLTGAVEPNSTPAMSHAMAARAPQGRAAVVPAAAHMMPMTHADEVNRVLTDFIQNTLAPQLKRT